jgi:beta-lactam-binding protein with PASTA domain
MKKEVDTEIKGSFEQFLTNGKLVFISVFGTICITALVCAVVFFVFVNRPEQVLVPNVVGKQLTTALLEMQVKELYPKLQLRYSDTADDKGLVLEQNPTQGSIVKAGRRITLVVSRGGIVDTVEDFIGQQYVDVQVKLQVMFSGVAKPLITLAEPSYTADIAEPGTILAQEPPAGTPISDPVAVKLVVSRGSQFDQTTVPHLVGMTVTDVLRQMERAKIIFDFTVRLAGAADRPGTVVSQEASNPNVPNYTRVKAEFALPENAIGGNIYGIFSADLADFPYPVPVQLVAKSPAGQSSTVVAFDHPGGHITIPYAVPARSELTLTAAGRTVTTQLVN